MGIEQEVTEGVQEGMFRVVNYDNFDETFSPVGEDHDSELNAVEAALRTQQQEREVNGEDSELAATFYIIPSKGIPLPLSHYEGKTFVEKIK